MAGKFVWDWRYAISSSSRYIDSRLIWIVYRDCYKKWPRRMNIITEITMDGYWFRLCLFFRNHILIRNYFQFQCGCTPVTVNWFLSLFHHSLQYLRTLHIHVVWSLVRSRGTQRLTRLQTMRNILKRSRFGSGNYFNLLMFSTVQRICNKQISHMIYVFYGLETSCEISLCLTRVR